MPSESAFKKLFDGAPNAAALEALKRLGPGAVADLCRAYARLGEHDFMQAQGYNCWLAIAAADPASEALTLLTKVTARLCPELTWVLRGFAQARHLPRLRTALARKVGYTASAPSVTLPSLSDLPRVAAWCEGVGLVGEPADLPLLGAVWQAASAELVRIEKKKGLFADAYAPVASAAAAGMLAISERAALANERARQPWRRACVQAALAEGYANTYMISAQTPPMPWLFARAPGEAAGLLAQVARQARDSAAVLAHLRYWLLTGQEQAAPGTLDVTADDALDWLDTLQANADPEGYGPACALELRALLRPANGLRAVMMQFLGPGLEMRVIQEAVDVLNALVSFKDRAALTVEAFFIWYSGTGKLDEETQQELNRQLAEAGLAPVEGWWWPAPAGRLTLGDTPEALHQMLCHIAHVYAQAARAKQPETAHATLAPLKDLPALPIVLHAVRRNALLALAACGQAGRSALLASLAPLRAETDPKQVKAVLVMAARILAKQAGPVYLLLLEAPAVRKSKVLAEAVVQGLGEVPTLQAAEPVLAFAKAQGWVGRRRPPALEIATTLALGRLGAADAAATLAREIGHSGLGSDTEVALLRMAAADPQRVDDDTFNQAFELMLADAYAAHHAAMWGAQASAYTVRLLRGADPASPYFGPLCKFLGDVGAKIEAPPQALPLLLARLPEAVARAMALPGEEWEDRNWGGYNTTGAEDTAEAMSQAILSLCQSRYTETGWRELIDGLCQLKNLTLTQVTLAESGPKSFSYPVKNLYDVLRTRLPRGSDPGLKAALAQLARP